MGALLVGLSASAQLYVTGNDVTGQPAAWNPGNPLEVQLENGTYTFKATGNFKMSTAKGTWDTFNGSVKALGGAWTKATATATNTLVSKGEDINAPMSGVEITYTVDEAISTITATLPEGMTFGDAPAKDFYLIGPAFCEWNLKQADYKMTPKGNNVYTYDCPNGINGEWKINDGTWDLGFGQGESGMPTVGKVYNLSSNGGAADLKSTITEAVTITFTYVDGGQSTLLISKQGDDPTPPTPPTDEFTYKLNSSITGNPTWEAIDLTDNNGKWEYTGTLVAGEFGFQKFDKDGKQVAWLAADDDANVTEAGKAYGVKDGGTNFSSMLEGNYTLSFDPAAMTVTFTKYDGPIDEVVTYALNGQIFEEGEDWTVKDLTEADGVWSWKGNVVAGSFGIKKMVNGSQKEWYAADGEPAMAETGTYQAKVNGTNWTSTLSGEYTFSFNPETLVLTVTGEEVPPTPPTDEFTYSLHGSITGNPLWESIALTDNNGKWDYTGALVEGSFGIKKIAKDGTETWLAAPADAAEVTEAGKAYTVTVGGTNFSSTLEGNYTISFDPAAMTVTFTKYDGPIVEAVTYALNGQIFEEGEDWTVKDLTEADGVWSWKGNVVAGSFGIKKMVNGSQKEWYAADGEPAMAETGTYQAKVNGTNWTSTLSGEYTFSFNPETLVLTVTGEEVPPTPPTDEFTYKLNSSITGNPTWEAIDLTDNNGKWEYTGTLVAGEFGFQKFDKDGKQVAWLAAADDAKVTEAGKAYGVKADGTNFSSTLEGNYTITFDPAAMTVTFTVYDGPIDEVVTYAINGQIFEEGEGWTVKDMTEADGVWSWTGDVVPGSFGIKKMVNGSQKEWYAADGDAAMETTGTYQAMVNGTNWTSTLTGNYKFTFNPETLVLTVENGAGIENITLPGNEAEAIYFNLQGHRVENPANGIFVRVANGKAVKVRR